ncbi:unnamed protein product [Nesidiocoris tenuis]|uniref:Selenide, water dikinase n=1 Tax=Nesidiocoris tenuis TaxID=355587 RepID=A0A6H5G3C9_9HEMI|nr:unnamed protein product [Nesidiocoris tenuis]
MTTMDGPQRSRKESFFKNFFRPSDHGLADNFRLTSFVLLNLLEGFDDVHPRQQYTDNESQPTTSGINDGPVVSSCAQTTVGIGLDSAVIELKDKIHSLVQTTDFLYPLIDDPYIMGKVACANVLSDLYAMGVPDCDNMLMLAGIPMKMTDTERDVAFAQMMKGFSDEAVAGNTYVTGGDTKYSEWCMIGGTATAIVKTESVILPYGAQLGDSLVLTKPLGTQNATFAYQWYQEGGEKWDKLSGVISEDEVQEGYFTAVESMIRLNKTGASLMAKHRAHAATDITGFGLLGHANNLARHQTDPVSLVIRKLPIINGMAAVERSIGDRFGLLSGKGIETSGGLLISLPQEEAPMFCRSIKDIDGFDAWIVGEVIEGDRTAFLDKNVELVEAR